MMCAPWFFSPNYYSDHQLIATVTDEKDTIITTRIGDSDWGTIIGDATIEGIVPLSAAIVFPDDYDATTTDYAIFAAIDTGIDKGDVYMVHANQAPGDSKITDLDIGSSYNLENIDVTGLAVTGNTVTASIVAGAANDTRIYISNDSGTSWTRCKKQPTGQSKTCIQLDNDYANNGVIYAATTGTESAFSCTMDGGVTWNQRGLIDTGISTIVDMAISPDYDRDNTIFMLTWGGEHSLWQSLDGGVIWERILTSTQSDIENINLVGLSPQYSNNNQVVFLTGSSQNKPAIWKSTDNGQTFKRRSTSFPIDVWTIVDNDTLFFGSYNGSAGLVYHTTNGGLSYSQGTEVGKQPLKSITLSPDYEQDNLILVGNTNGSVYWSDDNGNSFEPLPPDEISPPLTGSINVVFDPEFSKNRTIYATSDTKVTTESTGCIYRYTIGKSDSWESIDANIPIGGILTQPVIGVDGTLYVTNSQPADTVKNEGGMERSLNPSYPLGPKFETVTRGLDHDATLVGLWLRGNQLWSIDTTNTRLMTYIDSLAAEIILTSPIDEAAGIDVRDSSLDWETIKGATRYHWQLDYDTDFSTIPDEYEGDTKASSVRLPSLEMDTTYYWKVRAIEPVLSRWSDKWAFTTSLGNTVITSELLSPEAGSIEIPIRPVFQWSAIAGADSYELLVSTDSSFSDPVIARHGASALPATAWQSDVDLDYNTTYYWKVRASSSKSYSAWSAVGAFTTQSPTSQSLPSAESTSSSGQVASSPPSESSSSTPPVPSVVQSSFPDWAMYMVGILLLVIIILLITLVVLVVGMKRF